MAFYAVDDDASTVSTVMNDWTEGSRLPRNVVNTFYNYMRDRLSAGEPYDATVLADWDALTAPFRARTALTLMQKQARKLALEPHYLNPNANLLDQIEGYQAAWEMSDEYLVPELFSAREISHLMERGVLEDATFRMRPLLMPPEIPTDYTQAVTLDGMIDKYFDPMETMLHNDAGWSVIAAWFHEQLAELASAAMETHPRRQFSVHLRITVAFTTAANPGDVHFAVPAEQMALSSALDFHYVDPPEVSVIIVPMPAFVGGRVAASKRPYDEWIYHRGSFNSGLVFNHVKRAVINVHSADNELTSVATSVDTQAASVDTIPA